MARGNFSELVRIFFNSATQPEDEDEDEDENEDEDEEYLSMMDSVSERLGKCSNTRNVWSIYKVPSRLRELNEDAYTPRIVSIGPFHFGKENLQAMEIHKTRYMQLIFNRTKDPALTVSECVKAMLNMEKTARSYYYEYQTPVKVSSSSDRILAEILLVDGCFILELFFQLSYSTEISVDPILGASTICTLLRDLALLENQLPFFILESLFELIMKHKIPEHDDYMSLYAHCAHVFNLNLRQILYQSRSGCWHLLDLIRKGYLPRQELPSYRHCETDVSIYCCVRSKPRTKQNCKESWEFIHCVTKLRESGIAFVKGTSQNLFDIKFSPKGVLEIPKLCIDDTMASRLRNMIAFEQCCHWTSHHITSYAVLMDYLIDSPTDVEFLQQRRIIENYLGHGEEVSNIFNKISKNVFVKNFYFSALCYNVNDYCNLYWPRRRESFVRDHCSSPWKFMGVVAGSILLLFAGLQTGYTMASYHHPPK